ncbi:serine hydrolase [Micromonospora sp. NPDC005305]|uniref:serine hydrolase n=1 Tax=Micromonospora sp. NPDC005305 TaxID=3156875 RepID=UPI0033A91019
MALTTVLAVVAAAGPAAASGPHREPEAPRTWLVWLAFPGGVFSVDAAARTVRYRACDGDTGRVVDPGMWVDGRSAHGRLTVRGTTYRYDVPLVGRAPGELVVVPPDGPPRRHPGEVVSNPLPPTDPVAGRAFLPLTRPLQRIVAAAGTTGNLAGVTVRDLSGRFGGQQVSVDGRFRPRAASVIKLWIVTELLRRVGCGQVSLDQRVLVTRADVVGGTGQLQFEEIPQLASLDKLAQYTIKYSDNTAANVLINYLGGFAPVNALIDSMNQRETVLARKFLDAEAVARGEENYTSPDDVISLLGAVWDAQIVDPASRDLLIGFMREQTLNTKIPAALPPGTPVAHKTGDLPDVSHDVGYYLIPGEETAVAFLTSGPQATGDQVVRCLARAVYDYVTTSPVPVRPR